MIDRTRMTGAALLLCLFIGCGRDDPSSGASDQETPRDHGSQAEDGGVSGGLLSFARPEPPSTRYAGSAACAECHQSVCETYHAHPMGQSMGPAFDASVSELSSETEFTPGPGLTYNVLTEDERLIHRETRTTADGEVLYSLQQEPDYRVGSGEHGFSYLIESSGRFFQSPITWYSESAEWGLSPGYAPEYHPGFERLVTHDCIACHSGTANPDPQSRDRFLRPAITEAAISCERCHGPAADHIEFRSAAAGDSDASADPILHLGGESADVQNAVCFQCHLQGRARILQYGRHEFDFRPGMRMSDVWAVVMKSAGDAEEVNAVSHGEQMLSSRCFTESGRSLTCISCHDPHQRLSGPESVSQYRQSCLACHDTPEAECGLAESERRRQQPEDSCIACHMPSADLARVPHTANTDHRITVPGRRREAFSDSGSAEFPDVPGAPLTQSERMRADAVWAADIAYASGDPRAAESALQSLAPVLRAIPDDPVCLEAAGRAFSILRDPRSAVESWQQALRLMPGDVTLQLLIATELHEANRLQEAVTAYERLISSEPHRSLYHGRLAHLYGRLGNLEASVHAAQEALRRRPDLPQAHQWLAELYRRSGDTELSRKHAQAAEQLGQAFMRLREASSPDTSGSSNQQ